MDSEREGDLLVEVEPIGSSGLQRLLLRTGAVVYFLVAVVLLQVSDPLPLSRLVIRRRSSGEVLVTGAVSPDMRGWIQEGMAKDLERSSEAEFLRVWGDPQVWWKKYRAGDPGLTT